MKPIIFSVIALVNLVLVVGVVQSHVAGKDAILEDGRTVFLRLAPRDPRSLIQGDYMVLRQEISREASKLPASSEVPTRGELVLKIDEKEIGSVDRFSDEQDLLENEHPIRYRRTRSGFRFGIESFFFQEGDAKAFVSAQFAEVKISDSGSIVLVGLCDKDLKRIDPNDQPSD